LKSNGTAMEQTDLTGRICLITGASSGIGRATATALAGMGATLVMVSRGGGECPNVAEEIRKSTGNDRVEFMPCDLSSLQSLRDFTIAFRSRHNLLNILINNAGGVYKPRRESVDGFEMTFAVNHLAGFLLTNLLMPELKAGAPSRIINVSSGAQAMGEIDFDDLQTTKKAYKPFGAYAQSKLANVLFAYELARRLDGTGVTANALHPGTVRTGFGDTTEGVMKFLLQAIRPFLLTPEQGAATSIYLASSLDVEKVSGKYFVNKKPTKSAPRTYDVDLARRLWEVSEELTGLKTEAAGRR